MKVDLDLTKTNVNNEIYDELHADVGGSSFALDHDRFYASDLVIFTEASQAGTQFTFGVNYAIEGIDSTLTARAIENVYSTLL